MKQEKERKFLVKSSEYKKYSTRHSRIVQGYISTDPERSVRIRVMDNRGFITIKGKSVDSEGIIRPEWEKEIPVKEAEHLLGLCKNYPVEKIRYIVPFGRHIFEVDEFLGKNRGLTVAEIELEHADEKFDKPYWLGKEVSGASEYFNSSLSLNPYSRWK